MWFGIAMIFAFHLKNHFDVKNKTQIFKMLFNVFLIENDVFKKFCASDYRTHTNIKFMIKESLIYQRV